MELVVGWEPDCAEGGIRSKTPAVIAAPTTTIIMIATSIPTALFFLMPALLELKR